jgi:hypothetical protein
MMLIRIILLILIFVGGWGLFPAWGFTFLKEDVYEKAIKKFYVVPPKGTTRIVPKRLQFDPKKLEEAQEKIKKVTPEEVLKVVPKECKGGKYFFLPVKYLYFLPFRETT